MKRAARVIRAFSTDFKKWRRFSIRQNVVYLCAAIVYTTMADLDIFLLVGGRYKYLQDDPIYIWLG